MYRYFAIYKPYQVLSQFSPHQSKATLSSYFKLPKNVYPVGRLDYDSEGLLILTNDTSLNQRLLNPTHKHEREYWVQVEGNITMQEIEELKKGVIISVDGKAFKTLPCKPSIFSTPPNVFERHPPIRHRLNVPDSWMRLILHEGKNRQVRKMTASVGHPTLRLIRYRIERLTIENLRPGEIKELAKEEMYSVLFYNRNSG